MCMALEQVYLVFEQAQYPPVSHRKHRNRYHLGLKMSIKSVKSHEYHILFEVLFVRIHTVHAPWAFEFPWHFIWSGVLDINQMIL